MESWLEIRQVPDDAETLRGVVTAAEWETAAAMRSAVRRAEWLTWRGIVRERLGRSITLSYDANGAPALEEDHGCIGVSHTKGWVAVVWSPEKCAVDIEPAARDVSQTAARFISDDENGLADSGNALFPISVWCAKETLYKYSGIAGLDFLEDIRIVSSDIASGLMTGTVRNSPPLEIRSFLRDGLVIAIII